MIVYDGATGSLGGSFGAAAAAAGVPSLAIRARLEDGAGRRRELEVIAPLLRPGEPLAFVQMAGIVPVAVCERDPARAQDCNVIHVAEAVADVAACAARSGRILHLVYVGSGHVYAPATPGARVDESAALGPRSVYAKTKRAAEERVLALGSAAGFGVTVARVFGLLAPSQPPAYVLPALLHRVRTGDLDGIGGLDNVRDYLDARDVCRVLVLLAGQTAAGIVNVCSGEGIRIRDLLAGILRATGDARDASALVAGPSRPDDVPWIVGNPGKAEARLGASLRTLPLSRTIEDAVRGVK